MEQNKNFFTLDGATDEAAIVPSNSGDVSDQHPPAWFYWQGVADGIAKCGGIIPPFVLEQAGLGAAQDNTTIDGRDRLAFDTVPVRARHDGWTPARQRQFIEQLADCGIVRHAAAAVGMTEQSVSNLRRRSDARAFDAACDAALRLGARRLHSIAWERAIEGTVKPHYYHGELKCEERVYDNRLLIYLLGRTRHLDEPAPEAGQVLKNWDGWMDAIEQGASPPMAVSEQDAEEMDEAGDESESYGGEVWETEEGWVTDFPPPAGFEGFESDDYGAPDYYRALTAAEQAIIDADEAEEQAADLAEARARRDLYFGFHADQDSASLQASTTSSSEPYGDAMEGAPQPVEACPERLAQAGSRRGLAFSSRDQRSEGILRGLAERSLDEGTMAP